MEYISVCAFRRDTERIICRVQQGKRLILTYRGKPVLRLEPILDQQVGPDDCFYAIGTLAVDEGRSLSNEEIDAILYEK